MTDAWRIFLGRNDISLNQSAWDAEQDSPYTWNGIPASYDLDTDGEFPAMAGGTADEIRSLNDFLSDSNYPEPIQMIVLGQFLEYHISPPAFVRLSMHGSCGKR